MNGDAPPRCSWRTRSVRRGHPRTEGSSRLRAPLSRETPSQDSPATAPGPSSRPLMLKIAKSLRYKFPRGGSFQKRRQSTWCFSDSNYLSDRAQELLRRLLPVLGWPFVQRPEMTNCTALFRRHGPTSASGANGCGRRPRYNTCGNGARARRRMSLASKMTQCIRLLVPFCPDAAPPRRRGIHRAGRVAALDTPRIASRERQVEISNVLPDKSAKNRWISQPVARALYESLCLPPV